MTATKVTYRISEFATLAGVTVRALHHYDRVGLLRPKRSAAGYRLYSLHDLELLEQIVVLKFIGIPLREIADFLRKGSRPLARILRAQRGTLEKKQQMLQRAIAAIGALEAALVSGPVVEPAMFKRVIEVIEMSDNANTWKQNYDELVATKIDRLRGLSPEALAELRHRWGALTTEIRAALHEDPAGPKAQALGARWIELLGQIMGQPVDQNLLLGHQQAREWDPRMASFVDKTVWDYMTRVLAARR